MANVPNAKTVKAMLDAGREAAKTALKDKETQKQIASWGAKGAAIVGPAAWEEASKAEIGTGLPSSDAPTGEAIRRRPIQ